MHQHDGPVRPHGRVADCPALQVEGGGVGHYEVVDQRADQGQLHPTRAGGEGGQQDGQDGADVPASTDDLQEFLQRRLSGARLGIH